MQRYIAYFCCAHLLDDKHIKLCSHLSELSQLLVHNLSASWIKSHIKWSMQHFV